MEAHRVDPPDLPHALIEGRGLWKTYPRGKTPVDALRGVNLRLQRGELAAILGPSGGGKSTLLHLLGGIESPSAGELSVAGVRLDSASQSELTRFRRNHIGFIFQFYNLLPSLNALDNVTLPLLARGWQAREARRRSTALLERVGLQQRADHKPGELSGGEQQRVAIARALVGEPALILADEPTGDLDSHTAQEILALVQELNRELGLTFIIATHDPGVAACASRRFHMRDGMLSETGAMPPPDPSRLA